MVNILILTHSKVNSDGRLIEIKNVMNNIGETSLFQRNENESYIVFTYHMLKFIKNFRKSIDIILLDNTEVCMGYFLVSHLLKSKLKHSFIIKDFRELYLTNEMKSFKSKLASFFETKYYRKSNLIMCANKERADIMIKLFNLSKRPIVMENIRFLDKLVSEEHMLPSNFNAQQFNVVSSGGLSIARGTLQLIEGFCQLPKSFHLYIIGSGSQNDKIIIERYIEKHKIKNISILGKKSLSELATIVYKCDVGIVHYSQEDYNNRFCASGKLYEYLSLGIPIVTTSNKPLKNYCEKYNVGVVDDTFYRGILEIQDHYELYKNNANELFQKMDISKFRYNLSKIIKEEFNAYQME